MPSDGRRPVTIAPQGEEHGEDRVPHERVGEVARERPREAPEEGNDLQRMEVLPPADGRRCSACIGRRLPECPLVPAGPLRRMAAGRRQWRPERVKCLAKRGCSSMAEQKLPKLTTRVRFPSPAPALLPSSDYPPNAPPRPHGPKPLRSRIPAEAAMANGLMYPRTRRSDHVSHRPASRPQAPCRPEGPVRRHGAQDRARRATSWCVTPPTAPTGCCSRRARRIEARRNNGAVTLHGPTLGQIANDALASWNRDNWSPAQRALAGAFGMGMATFGYFRGGVRGLACAPRGRPARPRHRQREPGRDPQGQGDLHREDRPHRRARGAGVRLLAQPREPAAVDVARARDPLRRRRPLPLGRGWSAGRPVDGSRSSST